MVEVLFILKSKQGFIRHKRGYSGHGVGLSTGSEEKNLGHLLGWVRSLFCPCLC